MQVILIWLSPLVYGKDNFTDSAVSARVNGEHKEKDLEPWDGGEQHISGSLESLDTDLVRRQSTLVNIMYGLQLSFNYHISKIS